MLSISLMNGGASTALTVNSTRCVIGRGADCQVNLQGWRVSRRHAEIFVSNDRVYVRDLDSTFGTMVNDQKLEDAQSLTQGCVVRIGTHALTVRLIKQDGEGHAAANEPHAGQEAPRGAKRTSPTPAGHGGMAKPAPRITPPLLRFPGLLPAVWPWPPAWNPGCPVRAA